VECYRSDYIQSAAGKCKETECGLHVCLMSDGLL